MFETLNIDESCAVRFSSRTPKALLLLSSQWRLFVLAFLFSLTLSFSGWFAPITNSLFLRDVLTAWRQNGSGAAGDGTKTNQLLLNDATDPFKPIVFIASPNADQQLYLSDFSPGTIRGSATDNIGVAKIDIKLYRNRNGINQIWNGSSFTTTSKTVAADQSGSGPSVNWGLGRNFPATDQLDAGVYLLQAYATDAVGNTSTARTTFTLLNLPSPARNTAVGWGDNRYGQLGDGSAVNHLLPTSILGSGALRGKTITQLASGSLHTLALCSDGTVAGWGSGGLGQLGSGLNSYQTVPIKLNSILGSKTAAQLAAGYYHSVALCTDGTVIAWGDNRSGQSGDLYPVKSALLGKKVIQIAAGGSHTLALCSDGTVATWGDNQRGQLGDETLTNSSVPIAITDKGALNGKRVVRLVGGGLHSLALCSDGTLAAWGWNCFGELGVENGAGDDYRSLPVAINDRGALTGKTITQVVAGEYHSVALCSDGTLAAWGVGSAIGKEIGASQYSPIPVLGGALSGRTVVSVTAGSYHNLALCKDGSLVAWGGGESGQLGDGNTINRQSPIDITGQGALVHQRVTQMAAGQYHSIVLATLNPDTEKPVAVITTPTSNAQLSIASFNNTTITGTASDNEGVAKVQVKLYRTRNGMNQIWNGSTFTTTSTVIDADITSDGPTFQVDWRFNFKSPTSAQLDTGVYFLQVYATDASGNMGSARSSFTLLQPDTEKPVAFLSSPTPNQNIFLSDFGPGTISGTATDNVGVSKVKIRLARRRNKTTEFWNGTEFSSSTQYTVDAVVTGTTSATWSLQTATPPANKLDSGQYLVQVDAIDVQGNKGISELRTFNLGTDFILPGISISTPSANQNIPIASFGANSISGTASDNLGVTRVRVRLSRRRDNGITVWNGSTFINAATAVDVVVTPKGDPAVSWQFKQKLPTTVDLDSGVYEITAYALDAAGNMRTSSVRSFTLTDSQEAGHGAGVLTRSEKGS